MMNNKRTMLLITNLFLASEAYTNNMLFYDLSSDFIFALAALQVSARMRTYSRHVNCTKIVAKLKCQALEEQDRRKLSILCQQISALDMCNKKG